jgi:hypothetical protein
VSLSWFPAPQYWTEDLLYPSEVCL